MSGIGFEEGGQCVLVDVGVVCEHARRGDRERLILVHGVRITGRCRPVVYGVHREGDGRHVRVERAVIRL